MRIKTIDIRMSDDVMYFKWITVYVNGKEIGSKYIGIMDYPEVVAESLIWKHYRKPKYYRDTLHIGQLRNCKITIL